MKPLTPPDKNRCQAEKPTGKGFLTLGPATPYIRCTAIPVYIAKEIKPGKDRRRGAMSLCESCARVFELQCPGLAKLRRI